MSSTLPPTKSESKQEMVADNTPYLSSLKLWARKYFWEGQSLHKGVEAYDKNAPWQVRHRKLIGIAIPFLFFQILWWSYMITENQFYLFTERSGKKEIPRWYMSVTMIFGSMVAGGTSEGGASIAFPVMTLVFDISPSIARDFSFMIQSAGMTAAAFTVIWMKVKTEIHSIIYCTLGGIVGIIIGLEEIAPTLEPSQSKMYFVVIWFAFAFSLYWLNRFHGRKVYDEIPHWEKGVIFEYCGLAINWKAITLFCFGVLGGIFSGLAGSGIDICSFACLTLLFRVSEKTATPTSVVLMSMNTLVGFLYREFGMGGVESEAWGFLKVCVPIVVFGAPFGSVVFSHFHRLVLASCVYVTDTVQLIGALYVVQPWTHEKTDDPTQLCIASISIVIAGAIGFTIMAHAGQKLLQIQEKWEEKETKIDLELNSI